MNKEQFKNQILSFMEDTRELSLIIKDINQVYDEFESLSGNSDKKLLQQYTRFLRENDYFGKSSKNQIIGYVGEFMQERYKSKQSEVKKELPTDAAYMILTQQGYWFKEITSCKSIEQEKKVAGDIIKAIKKASNWGVLPTDEWTDPKISPEFDGTYLCYISQLQECGNTWYYQEVVVLKFNAWLLKGDEVVVKWRVKPNDPLQPETVEAKEEYMLIQNQDGSIGGSLGNKQQDKECKCDPESEFINDSGHVECSVCNKVVRI